MKTGRTNTTGQLRPLKERLSEYKMGKRKINSQARAIVAAQLRGEINGLGHYVVSVLGRRFLGRMRWLFTGK